MNPSFLPSGELPLTWSALSDRERTVLILIGQGLLDKEIADALHICSSTAISHKNHAFGKLGLAGQRDLFQFVARFPHLFLPKDNKTPGD
jgi:DNA-binding CsgD family transcriptional regulator